MTVQESMGTIERFIQEVGVAEKRAEAHTEPGSQGGETSHPVKDVDDRTETAQEGFRSSENESDVKEDQGEPGVDATPEASAKTAATRKQADGGAVQTPGSAHDDHLNIGTNAQPTGEDPSNETSKAKDGKEDPGSSHPARTDNEQLDGHKYSSDRLQGMNLHELTKLAADLGNDICVALASDDESDKQAGDDKHERNGKQASDEDPDLAHQAGWELAGLASGDFDKQAADAMVHDTLCEVVKTAADDADKVARFLNQFYQEKQAQQQKRAMGEGAPLEDPAAAMGAPPAGGMPAPGPEAGGMEAAMGGGEPPVGGGDDLAQLAAVLEELGITPDDLIAMLQEGGEAPPEGAPPEGGPAEGAPPEGAPPEGPPGVEGDKGLEVEAGDKRQSQNKTAAAKKGNAQASIRDYVREVVQRSRAK